MPRPDLGARQRAEYLPIVARTFAELGYRRTTTAELARRCGAQERVLFRRWPGKKAMFLAAIAYVFEHSRETWKAIAAAGGEAAAERLLEYEGRHHGEFGLYRIVFAGLTESDDPEIRAALVTMYRAFQRYLRRQIAAHRGTRRGARGPSDDVSAWALIGLGTMSSIVRELGLAPASLRRRLFDEAGRALLDSTDFPPRRARKIRPRPGTGRVERGESAP